MQFGYNNTAANDRDQTDHTQTVIGIPPGQDQDEQCTSETTWSMPSNVFILPRDHKMGRMRTMDDERTTIQHRNANTGTKDTDNVRVNQPGILPVLSIKT